VTERQEASQPGRVLPSLSLQAVTAVAAIEKDGGHPQGALFGDQKRKRIPQHAGRSITLIFVSDDKPKSAFELAMERLRQRDEEAGVEHRPLTDDQKTAIAEARSFYQSKIAEQEVLHQSRLRKTFEPVERETLEAEFRRDRERLTSERDAKIEKIRGS
jgi:hypothetical protein